MDKKKIPLLVFGILLIAVAVLELFFFFINPVALLVRPRIYLYPELVFFEYDNTEIMDYLEKVLFKTGTYTVISQYEAGDVLRKKNHTVDDMIDITLTGKQNAFNIAELISANFVCVGLIQKIQKKGEGPEDYVFRSDAEQEESYYLYLSVWDTNHDIKVKQLEMNFESLEDFYLRENEIIKGLTKKSVGLSISDHIYLFILAFQFICGILFVIVYYRSKKAELLHLRYVHFLYYRIPELIFCISLIMYLFDFVYALNANMDYVHKFIALEGKIDLAQDTFTQRIYSTLQYLPVLLINGFIYFYIRIKDKQETGEDKTRIIRDWSLLFALSSSFLTAIAFPSFLSIDGFWPLAFISLIPLFLVLRENSYWQIAFYGTAFGVLYMFILNYWLATYSLISLAIVIMAYSFIFLGFMLIMGLLLKVIKKGQFLIIPCAWVLFDFIRSIGVLGYNWGMIGVSQYQFLPVIQVAAFTGVWGVTFIVLLINSTAAETLLFLLKKKKAPLNIIIPVSVIVFLCIAYGSIYLLINYSKDKELHHYRVALIQQNTDPRKSDKEKTFSTLIGLSEKALINKPDFLVWSEGAFREPINQFNDPQHYAAIPKLIDFITKHKKFLVSGGFYRVLIDEETEEGKNYKSYNSTFLLSDHGEVLQVYNKNHLVPFSEYIPFKKEIPWLYEILKEWDTSDFEPGTVRTIFNHPDFTFITPVCFEDVFGHELRKTISLGVDVVINVSNDYWSLTPIEAKQHTIHALFLTVENNRPLLRSTCSGLTCYINRFGAFEKTAPYYEDTFIITEVPIVKRDFTVYTMFGDWFPALLAIFILFSIIISIIPGKQDPKKDHKHK